MLSGVDHGCTLGRGKIFADFHRSGKTPSLSELLKMAASGLGKMTENSFRIQAGIPSGPVALLVFTLFNAASTSSRSPLRKSRLH